MAAKKKSSGGRRTSSRVLGLNAATVKESAFLFGGMLGTNYLVDQLPIPQLKTGGGRIAGKAVVAVGGAYVLRRFAGASISNAFLKGGLMAVIGDVYGMAMGQRQTSRLAGIPYGYESLNGGGIGAIGYFPGTADQELEDIMRDDSSIAA